MKKMENKNENSEIPEIINKKTHMVCLNWC
jgi:hypothetical protein